ncbi:hypothetical protein D3C87_2103540 [compost metagenome]
MLLNLSMPADSSASIRAILSVGDMNATDDTTPERTMEQAASAGRMNVRFIDYLSEVT